MPSTTSEFHQEERPQIELLRTSLEDAEDQLRRARLRLDRAQRRVRNLEVAVQSWKALVTQYEQGNGVETDRRGTEIQL
jgi:multidrug resistance efflux pump